MTQNDTSRDVRQDRLKASKALRYEWWMLDECADKAPLYKDKDTIVHNSLIEAFCVHCKVNNLLSHLTFKRLRLEKKDRKQMGSGADRK